MVFGVFLQSKFNHFGNSENIERNGIHVRCAERRVTQWGVGGPSPQWVKVSGTAGKSEDARITTLSEMKINVTGGGVF